VSWRTLQHRNPFHSLRASACLDYIHKAYIRLFAIYQGCDAGDDIVTAVCPRPRNAESGLSTPTSRKNAPIEELRALNLARSEVSDAFPPPSLAGGWADLLETWNASRSLELDSTQLLNALKELQTWTAACREHVASAQEDSQQRIDGIGADAANTLQEIIRAVSKMKLEAQHSQQVVHLQHQVVELEQRLEGEAVPSRAPLSYSATLNASQLH